MISFGPMGLRVQLREPALLARLRKHLGVDPSTLTVIEQKYETYERPNLHLAIEELMAEAGRRSELVGIVSPHEYDSPSLAKLSRKRSAGMYEPGPVEYVDVPLADERRLACVKSGLYLFHGEKDVPIAMLIAEGGRMGPMQKISLEFTARNRDAAETFSRKLLKQTRYGKAFRGNVLSIESDCYHQMTVKFHRLPPVSREQIILPESLMKRIERHTLTFTKHADVLKAAGRHLKRGILLFGPPGTGKTLSAMYLASQMPGRTVLLLTGAAIGSIETVCTLARMLEPATVILEDVDLIGTEREHQQIGANALLFELLNQMDGLAEDVDVLFVLTTNRPDILEPALASRPGRIDQAIEVPPPDADCRRRLLELYARGMNVQLADREKLIARTAGVSGAFIRELLRKAAVYAAENNNGDGAAAAPLVVRDEHLDEALTELLVTGGALTKQLLGAVAGTLTRNKRAVTKRRRGRRKE